MWSSVQSWEEFYTRFSVLRSTVQSDKDVLNYYYECERDHRHGSRDILHSFSTVIFAGVLGRVLASRRFDWLQTWNTKEGVANAVDDLLTAGTMRSHTEQKSALGGS